MMDRKLLKRNRGETFPCFLVKCVETRKVLEQSTHTARLSYCLLEVGRGRIIIYIFELSDLFLHHRSPGVVNHRHRNSRGNMRLLARDIISKCAL